MHNTLKVSGLSIKTIRRYDSNCFDSRLNNAIRFFVCLLDEYYDFGISMPIIGKIKENRISGTNTENRKKILCRIFF